VRNKAAHLHTPASAASRDLPCNAGICCRIQPHARRAHHTIRTYGGGMRQDKALMMREGGGVRRAGYVGGSGSLRPPPRTPLC
jgi:hypothetical protein